MKYTTTLIIIVAVLIIMKNMRSKTELFENYPKNFHLKREPSCYYVSKDNMNRAQSSGM